MNTPESDRIQAEYARDWLRKKSKKKMDKLEEKLRKVAKGYFGEDVAVIYARKGAIVEDQNGERYVVSPNQKR